MSDHQSEDDDASTVVDPAADAFNDAAVDDDDDENRLLLRKYLDRIRIDAETADRILAATGEYEPNLEDLGMLLRHHLLAVPFENLSQHVHPASSEGDRTGTGNGTGEPTTVVPEVPISRLPSLSVADTLHKIVVERRGGFCWEINLAFAWLLQRLGYQRVRLANAHVWTPHGPVKGHLCLFVESVRETTTSSSLSSSSLSSSSSTKRGVYHVDPGFGDAPRTPLPATLDAPATDPMLGDDYVFVENNDDANRDRFPVLLMRRRKKGGMGASPNADFLDLDLAPTISDSSVSPADLEPVYYLNFDDDLDARCPEFEEGLSHVLETETTTNSNLFAKKRLCVILKDTGFDYVGRHYWKQVRNGKEVTRHSIATEAEYRRILDDVAGIRL